MQVVTIFVLLAISACVCHAGNKYKMFKGPFNFEEARLKCQVEGMQIAVIRNIADKIQADRETRSTGGNQGCVSRGHGCRVFIGYKRLSRGGAFHWIGGSSTYKYFHTGEPNNYGGDERCVELNFYGHAEWNDISCGTRLGVLCEPRRDFVMIKGTFDFDGAKKACQDAGMRLAVIKNEQEQLAAAKATRVADHPGCVHNRNLGGCRAFIAYKRVSRGGAFKWIGGESSYRYFARHEPNNWGGDERCVEVNFYGHAKAEWNDIACATRLSALCQPSPKFVMIKGTRNFDESKRKCEEHGLKIAVIKNQLEQQVAAKVTRVKDHPGCVHNRNLGGCRAFIAYKRVSRGGAFHWIGGTSSYKYFASHEPNNWGGDEGCVELNFYGHAKAEWNDISCAARLSVLCARP